MRILTDNEMEFLIDYYRQIINLSKSSDIIIRCRFHMSQIRVYMSCPWYNEENMNEENN